MGMRVVLFLLFYLSGMAGLIYEVVWAKHLSLLLGNTTHAHTIVLATFMGGLALGYYAFGRIADRAEGLLNLYAWLEIGIGLFGGLFIPLLVWLGTAYLSLVGYFGLESALAALFRFSLSAVLIFPTTFLMGGTLPVVSRFFVRSLGEVERQVGLLYFLNSLGAVFGGLLAGFYLIPRLGLNLSLSVAVGLNLVVGLVALGLRSREVRERDIALSEAASPGGGNEPYTSWQVRVVILGAALSGCAALIYEIAWIRLLSLVLGSSVYSFSLMLSAFIAGIGLGSFLVSQRSAARLDSYLVFALAQLGVALSVLLTLPLYERLPFYFGVLANLFVRAPETFWLYMLVQFTVCFPLMILPTLFMGMSLPLASQVAARSLKSLGEQIGSVFAANTAGTLLGAATAGLILLPLLGIKGLIELGVVINLFVGASVLGFASGLGRASRVLVSGTAFAAFGAYLYLFSAWDQNILSSGVFRERRFYAGMTFEEFKRRHQEKILYYRDGANMTVTVTRGEEDHITLRVNGKPDASSRGDLPTQILLGQIPMILKPDARDVLVVGLGSGVTVGSVLSHPVERLDVVEISPEVVEASRLFAPYHHDALEDRRVRLYVEDAKTVLKTVREDYDVIISEPSNPWIAGIGSLYTVEFYRDVRQRLKPEGLLIQWFHVYEMTDESSKLMLRTFANSFEHVTLWSPMGEDLILVGSKAPLSIDFQRSMARIGDPKVRADLSRIGMESLATLLSLQVASDGGVRRAAGKGRLNEDLFPILEYEAPKAFFLGQTSRFLESFDERRHPRGDSPLYLARYLQASRLRPGEMRELTLYHLNHGSPAEPLLAHAFLVLWLREVPGDPEARRLRARMEQQGGNLEAAHRELQELLKLRPDDPELLEMAAQVEFRRYLNERSLLHPRGPEKALGYLHRLASLDESRKDRVYRKIAQVHSAHGDYRSAIAFLDKAALHAQTHQGGFRPDSLWLEAASVAMDANDLESAIAYARKALDHNPRNETAKRSLKELSKLRKAAR